MSLSNMRPVVLQLGDQEINKNVNAVISDPNFKMPPAPRGPHMMPPDRPVMRATLRQDSR